MSGSTAASFSEPLRMRMSPTLERLSDHEFFEFCQLNREWRIERTSAGDIVIMPPTGGKTGRRNAHLTKVLAAWADADGSGIAFDSSTGFALPDGAKRSPDAAWVKRERWDRLSDEDQEEFPPLCPDFVAELRSPSDSPAALREKMEEYIANGAQLGWLIDPIEQRVYVYRPEVPPERLDHPEHLSGDPVLPGFVLDTENLW
jgi:Uma2 family endonuclease